MTEQVWIIWILPDPDTLSHFDRAGGGGGGPPHTAAASRPAASAVSGSPCIRAAEAAAGRENSFWFCVCPVVPGEKDKYRPSKKEEPLQL